MSISIILFHSLSRLSRVKTLARLGARRNEPWAHYKLSIWSSKRWIAKGMGGSSNIQASRWRPIKLLRKSFLWNKISFRNFIPLHSPLWRMPSEIGLEKTENLTTIMCCGSTQTHETILSASPSKLKSFQDVAEFIDRILCFQSVRHNFGRNSDLGFWSNLFYLLLRSDIYITYCSSRYVESWALFE